MSDEAIINALATLAQELEAAEAALRRAVDAANRAAPDTGHAEEILDALLQVRLWKENARTLRLIGEQGLAAQETDRP